jgi:hypothetical protein
MKSVYLNGLSKVMLAIYGTAIVFGPPSVAQFIADSVVQGGSSEAVTRVIWMVGPVYVFCVSPFILAAVTRRWREVILGIIAK